MEMAEYILTPGRAVSKQFATTCLEGLISIGPVSYDRAELLLGKLFLEGKLIDSNYEKAQKFFQLAIDREENPLKKEPLKQAIEVLERKYFHDFYQKIRLFSYSDEEISLPPELSQYIFSMGVAAIKKEPRWTVFLSQQDKASIQPVFLPIVQMSHFQIHRYRGET